MEPISAAQACGAAIVSAAVVVVAKLVIRWRRGIPQNPGASVTDCLSAGAIVPFLLLSYSAIAPGQAEILLENLAIPMALAGLIAVIHMLFQLCRF